MRDTSICIKEVFHHLAVIHLFFLSVISMIHTNKQTTWSEEIFLWLAETMLPTPLRDKYAFYWWEVVITVIASAMLCYSTGYWHIGFFPIVPEHLNWCKCCSTASMTASVVLGDFLLYNQIAYSTPDQVHMGKFVMQIHLVTSLFQ